jgi:sigma-B regulation protein RsbU (phosphoserine phosphatase)
LPNDVQEVPRLAAFVEDICEVAGIDMGTTMKMNLAIEEAVVNVMNYAYPSGVKGEVRIEAGVREGYVEFVISDDGTPFNPTEVEDADTTLSAEERQIGGLGIFLVKHFMDIVEYKYVDGQNVLTLRKNLQ